MVIYNAATRELTAKIVYYGPGLGGKTTNLQLLHERLEPATVGKLLNLATQTDRTIYFDLLPVELGDIKGYKIRFQLATVPGPDRLQRDAPRRPEGHRRHRLRRRLAVDDASEEPRELAEPQGQPEGQRRLVRGDPDRHPVQQAGPDATSSPSTRCRRRLGLSSYPFVEAVASAGRGVTETFKLISKLTFVDLLRRLQGRKPEEAGPVPPSRRGSRTTCSRGRTRS